MKRFLCACLITLFFGKVNAQEPNIIVILADDLGWADLACYGSTFYETPHLDQLARSGARFTQAYAAAPICSPSRAAILTGKYPARLNLTDWLPGRPDRPDQRLARPQINQALPLKEMTLAEVLKQKGYATCHIGKWHLGREKFSPREQGFDLNIAGDHTGTPLSYFSPFQRGGQIMIGLESSAPEEYLTDRLTAEALKFIEANKSKKFFLYLPHYTVHIPLIAKTNYVRRFLAKNPDGSQTNAIYAAMIQSLDESIGAITAKLDQLNLRTNTLVIFTSDNGGLSVKEGANTPATSNAPLRAGKGYLYEGGIRVPLIMSMPNSIPANTVITTQACGIDLAPTILQLCGIEAPIMDGQSLRAALKGKLEPTRPLFWHYPHYSNQGGKPGGAINLGGLKLIEQFETGTLELYDLNKDPGEQTDLAAKMPDKALQLQKQLDAWRRSVGAMMPALNANYVAK